MSGQLRARVERVKYEGALLPAWRAIVTLTNGDNTPQALGITSARTQPEVLDAAFIMLADIDRELMAEVHTSRARRRDLTKTNNPPKETNR